MGMKDILKMSVLMGTVTLGAFSSEAKTTKYSFSNVKFNAGNAVSMVASGVNSSQIKTEYAAKQEEIYVKAAQQLQLNESKFMRELTNNLHLPNSSKWDDIYPDFEACNQAKNLQEFQEAYSTACAKQNQLNKTLPGKLSGHLSKQTSACKSYMNKAVSNIKKEDRLLERNATWGSNQLKGITGGIGWASSSKSKNSSMSRGFEVAGNAGTALRAAIALTDSSTWSAQMGCVMDFTEASYGQILTSQALIEGLKSSDQARQAAATYGAQLAGQEGNTEYQQQMLAESKLSKEADIDKQSRSLYDKQEKELYKISETVAQYSGSKQGSIDRAKMLSTAGFTSKATKGIGFTQKTSRTY